MEASFVVVQALLNTIMLYVKTLMGIILYPLLAPHSA